MQDENVCLHYLLYLSLYQKDCHIETKNTNKKVEKKTLVDKELITHGKSTRAYTCKKILKAPKIPSKLATSVFHLLVLNPSAFHRIRSTILQVFYHVKYSFTLTVPPLTANHY